MRGVRRFECLFRKIPATALIVGLEIIVLGAFEACRYETAVRLCWHDILPFHRVDALAKSKNYDALAQPDRPKGSRSRLTANNSVVGFELDQLLLAPHLEDSAHSPIDLIRQRACVEDEGAMALLVLTWHRP